jgi:hypothetical protein
MAAEKVKKNKYGPVGREDVDMNSLRPGYIRVIHKAPNDYNAQPGELLDGDSGAHLGKEITVIPIKKFIDWVKFSKDDFKPEDRSFDGKTWVSGKPFAKDEDWKFKRINFLVFIAGMDSKMPLILSFSKTSLAAGRKMDAVIAKNNIANDMPIFANMFKVWTTKESNDAKQTYFILNVEKLPEDAPEKVQDEANRQFEAYTKMLAEDRTRILAAPKEAPQLAEGARKKTDRKY